MKKPRRPDSTLQHEELSDLSRDGEIPDAPSYPVFNVEQLYLELKHRYLSHDKWLACVQTAALALDPCQQKSAKAQLIALYASASGSEPLSNKECENFAEAWIHAGEARRAVDGGHGDAAQAHLDSAYILLTTNLKSRRRREISDNNAKGKAKARQECTEEFAKLVRARRPARGWRLLTDVAKTLGPKLATIIEEKEVECGPLWNRDPNDLIDEWLSRKKGPVYEAYRGRGS